MYLYSSLSDPIEYPYVASHQFISITKNLTYILILI